MKILLVDSKIRFEKVTGLLSKALVSRGLDVQEIIWEKTSDSTQIKEEDISRVIVASKNFDAVIVHLGGHPRGKGAGIIKNIKANGARVVVNCQSSLLFEDADAVMDLVLFKYLDRLFKFLDDSNLKNSNCN